MAIIFLWLGAGLAFADLMQIATGRPKEGHWQRSAVKTGATLALVAAGLAAPAPALIVLGLALGAAGDFLLSRLGRAMFLAGMAAFAMGHLAYAVGFALRANALGFSVPSPAQGAALTVLALVVLMFGHWLAALAKDLAVPVFLYALVILGMATLALTLPFHTGQKLIQAGAALFLLSDTLLAIRLFASPPAAKKPLDLAVWPSYWLGQALILVGAVIYWEFPKS